MHLSNKQQKNMINFFIGSTTKCFLLLLHKLHFPSLLTKCPTTAVPIWFSLLGVVPAISLPSRHAFLLMTKGGEEVIELGLRMCLLCVQELDKSMQMIVFLKFSIMMVFLEQQEICFNCIMECYHCCKLVYVYKNPWLSFQDSYFCCLMSNHVHLRGRENIFMGSLKLIYS